MLLLVLANSDTLSQEMFISICDGLYIWPDLWSEHEFLNSRVSERWELCSATPPPKKNLTPILISCFCMSVLKMCFIVSNESRIVWFWIVLSYTGDRHLPTKLLLVVSWQQKDWQGFLDCAFSFLTKLVLSPSLAKPAAPALMLVNKAQRGLLEPLSWIHSDLRILWKA